MSDSVKDRIPLPLGGAARRALCVALLGCAATRGGPASVDAGSALPPLELPSCAALPRVPTPLWHLATVPDPGVATAVVVRAVDVRAQPLAGAFAELDTAGVRLPGAAADTAGTGTMRLPAPPGPARLMVGRVGYARAALRARPRSGYVDTVVVALGLMCSPG